MTEAAHMTTHGWMGKPNIACAYSEILLTHKIEGHSDTRYSMEEP